jgi:tetratricopeptide (TPR) repeat protein
MSLLALSKYDQAAAALKRAVDIGGRPEPMYALAQAYARLGDKEKAFDWLDRALTMKLSQANEIESEPNLASLRGDPRFARTRQGIDKLIHPCMYQPEYKQFDFWVGDWEVSDGGQKVAASSIQRIVENCIIYENYVESDGYVGKSFNFYDGTLHKWRQTWVDGIGRASEFVGEFKDGAMRFEGESHLSDGTKILRRMTLFNLNPTQVRQLSHASKDNGKTWYVNYDYIYTRTK